jgi:Cu-Zn family superoxide dismutase
MDTQPWYLARVVPLVAFFSVSCGQADTGEDPDTVPPAEDSVAVVEGLGYVVAELSPTLGHEARGTVTFTFDPNFPGADVEAQLTGLPAGQHGFHIHEFGDCSAPDASSAGGHLNPGGSPHGSPDNAAEGRHLGDLGNIEAGSDTVTIFTRHDQLLAHSGDSIVGKAVVVHELPDDFVTQPDGGGGARIACGVIREGEIEPR